MEDRKDPLQLGRCRIRILGYHTDNRSISKLPIGDLPWAYPAQPITSSAMSGVGQTPLGPVEGTWVIGYFRDGEDAQQPVFFATLGGIPQELADNGKGFNAPIAPRDEMAVLAEFGAKSVDEFSKHFKWDIDVKYEKLMKKKTSPNEYIGIAKISSSQINSLIIELTDSGATQEWVESYVNYIGALKKLNEKITETIVVANLMNDNDNSNSINEIIAKIHQLETESLDLIKKSDNTRP